MYDQQNIKIYIKMLASKEEEEAERNKERMNERKGRQNSKRYHIHQSEVKNFTTVMFQAVTARPSG